MSARRLEDAEAHRSGVAAALQRQESSPDRVFSRDTYYHTFRTHLALGKDAPISRQVQVPTAGAIVEVAHVGGLHHHDEPRAA